MEITRRYKGLEALKIESAASKVRLYDGLELESRSRVEKIDKSYGYRGND